MSGDLPPPDPSQRNQYVPEPKAPGRSAEYERLRRVLIPLAGLAMVLFAVGLGAFVLRDNDEGGPPDAGAGTAAPVATSPTAEASPTTAATTAAPSSTAAAAPASTTTVAAASVTTTTTRAGHDRLDGALRP